MPNAGRRWAYRLFKNPPSATWLAQWSTHAWRAIALAVIIVLVTALSLKRAITMPIIQIPTNRSGGGASRGRLLRRSATFVAPTIVAFLFQRWFLAYVVVVGGLPDSDYVDGRNALTVAR